MEEGGENRGGRATQPEKTSANPSASTSRTTSPLSSIGNTTSDTQMESVSLSLSQSPPPNTDEDMGEQGSKSCNNVTSTMTAPQGKVTTKVQEESKTVELSAVLVKGTESLEQAPRTCSDSASIEWDMSQMRQDGEADSDTKLKSVVHRKRTYRKRCSYHGELVNDTTTEAEVSPQHNTPICSINSFNVSNGVLDLDSNTPHSQTTTPETHAANPLPSISSFTPSSVHHDNTKTFTQSSSSQTRILDLKLPSKRLKENILDPTLDRNGDSGQNFILNEHEE